ncbi:MAG: cell division ATP-binding protein FtsE [Candidatus Zixiibacteriota bacterium]
MIEFHNVSKTFKDWIALSNVSFDFDDEEFLYLVGNSGAGKTTLLRLIYMQQLPTSGYAEILGFRTDQIEENKIPELRRQFGYVFQDFRLLPELNVEQQVQFVMTVTGKSKRFIKQRTFQALSEVGLLHKAKAMPNELSGGEAQRVAIARAISNYPKVILADEPTGNLDPGATQDVIELLLKINKQGTAVIMATHDIDIVEENPSRTIELQDGVVVGDTKLGGR